MKQAIYLFVLCILLFSACKNDNLFVALNQAGNNCSELERVLEYYKDDTLKYRAACFLIENMPGKIQLEKSSVTSIQPYYNAFEKYRTEHDNYDINVLYLVADSMKKLLGENYKFNPQYILDIKSMSSEELIKHIDEAFRIWNYPWCKDINFDTFCKYILPYKVTDYYWSGSVEYFRNQYSQFIDTCMNPSYIEVGRYIFNDINKNFIEVSTFKKQYPFLFPTTFDNIVKTRFGACIDKNSISITAMRSLGIPATICVIPNWGNFNPSHFFIEIIGEPKKKLYDNTQRAYTGMDEELINDMFWIREPVEDFTGIPTNINIVSNRTVPKIYRMNYEIQEYSLAYQAKEAIPLFFKDYTLEDVTDKYLVCKDVEIGIPKNTISNEYIYLCCYEPERKGWVAVDWATKNGDKSVFKNVGINVLYVSAYYDGLTIVPFGKPFILEADGSLKYIEADTTIRESSTLFSKVSLRTRHIYYASRMKGRRIQVYNRQDLSDTTTIYTIKNIPYYMQQTLIEDCPPSRYVIYKMERTSSEYVAELEFYGENEDGDEIKLEGKEIGNPGIAPVNIRHNAFDGDRVSFFQSDPVQKEDYIGLDFGKPIKITKIKYCPRNDDNAIVPGEMYELYYWSDGWQSLGKQKGRDDYRLVYDNVPKNALLRIHNHTRGKENRPFTMEDGKQVWW